MVVRYECSYLSLRPNSQAIRMIERIKELICMFMAFKIQIGLCYMNFTPLGPTSDLPSKPELVVQFQLF